MSARLVNNEQPLVGTLEILGHECDVTVDHWGYFHVHLDGEQLTTHSSTLATAEADAKEKLTKRRVKVSVPFRKDKLERGVATSIHSANGHVMATLRTEGRGRTTQDQLESRTSVWRDDTPDTVFDEYEARRQEIRLLEDEQREVEHEWRFQIGDVVREAINEAAQEALAPTTTA